MDQQDKISILGPRDDGTYVVEFRMAEGKKLAITVPSTKAAVLSTSRPRQQSSIHRSLMRARWLA